MAKRVVWYFILLSIATGIFVWYIDAKFLYNLEKANLSFNKNIELKPFSEIRGKIISENSFKSKVDAYNGEIFFQMDGFEKLQMSNQNKAILKRNSIHSSQQLALFSMAYATDYLILKSQNAKLSKNDIEILNEMYEFISSEVLNYISLNNMTVNDHAVAERVQFVMLYLSYLQNFEPSQHLIITKLQKDLNICVGFLLNDDHFTWQTNHGIMQLRALAQIAEFTSDKVIKMKVLDAFDERLKLIVPYFLGEDGAIYESATGYWKYIYSQFAKLTEIESVKNMSSVKELKNRLIKSSRFIEVVTTNDGFMQGVGDSYSNFNKKSIIESRHEDIPENRQFYFSNQIAGYNWTENNVNSSILFVSMHTPPNVHKLPEDLAIYVYANGPFFANTGIFAYGTSEVRTFFEREASQSTIRKSLVTHLKPSGSLILKPFEDSTGNVIIGKKFYADADTIFRILKMKMNNSFELIDCSISGEQLCCSFNLHPSVDILEYNDSAIILSNSNNVKLKIISNNKITLTKSIISDRYNHTVNVNRINIYGSKIINSFYLINPALESSKPISFEKIDFPSTNNRLANAIEINKIYNSNSEVKQNFRQFFFKTLAVTLLLYLLIIMFVDYNLNKRAKK